MNFFSVFFPIFSFIVLLGTLYIFPNFYIKFIINKKVVNILFRVMLITFLLVTQLYFYINFLLANGGYKNWHNWFYLEICNVVNWVAIFLLIFPNKLLLDCTLPLGIAGPSLTILLGSLAVQFKMEEYMYWQFYFGHMTIIFSYLFLYNYGFTKSKFDINIIKRSLTFITIFGLSTEVYNLAFGTNYMISDLVGVFPSINTKDQIYQFLFVFVWIFPLVFSIMYVVIWYFKPIYSCDLKQRINDTWLEKIIKKIKNRKTNKKN